MTTVLDGIKQAVFVGTWRGPKQPGRTYGPPPKPRGPRYGHAEPMQGGRRLTNYCRQRGKEWVRPTARQKRRIEKKWRHAAANGMPWAFEHLTADSPRRHAVEAAYRPRPDYLVAKKALKSATEENES